MKRLAAVVLGLGIGLVLSEVLVRVCPSSFRDRVIRQSYIESRHTMQDDFCERDTDPLIGWHNIPRQQGIFENREFKTAVHFNALGLRGADSPLDSAPKRRVLFLGDSVTVGWGVNDQETFPALIQAATSSWQILNAGVAGYSTRNEWGLLQKRGRLFNPTDVVLVFYPNDPIEASFPTTFQKRSKRPKPETRWYLRELLRAAHEPKTEPWPYYYGINHEHWKHCVSYLELIRSWCLIHRARFFLVYVPFKDELGERFPVGYRKEVLLYCREKHVPCADMTPTLAAVPRSAGYYAIAEHLTPLGHALVAEHLEPWLMDVQGKALNSA